MLDASAIARLGVGQGPRALATAGFSIGSARAFADPTDRRVAVQGVGFTTRLTALQGFGVVQRQAFPSGANRRRAPARHRRDDDNDVLLFLLR